MTKYQTAALAIASARLDAIIASGHITGAAYRVASDAYEVARAERGNLKPVHSLYYNNPSKYINSNND